MDSDTHSGTLALLFTDIEGSTKLWEQEPERMPIALARHDALVRGAVAAEGGTVVKMIGDGTEAVFDDPLHAMSAALRIQQELADPFSTAGLALSVRCGLHWGAVQMRDNDYFGSAVNLAARITGLASGGQVLVSQAVADAVIARVLPGTSLHDLGEVRLKGLAATERVYQIVHSGLRQDFPALRSLEATPNNLPQQLTSFIGREREIGDAKSLLERTRLLTLVGIGGLGKTRLSLQIGTDLLDTFRDGVWFVELAPVRDPSLVMSETAKVLGVREEPNRPLIQTLCAHLKPRKLMLILDNCEHLIQPSAGLAHAILQAAPDLRIIATSREPLHVPGEQTYPVLPLPVPNRSDGVDALLRSTAARLFVDRARLHKPSFSLSERDAPALAELVARLEGIPLAIELAAARTRSLTVADINTRLKERYKLLTGGDRVLLERHQTLGALVDWSYDLLDRDERTVLDRLSVFVGGFDLAAAEQVCGTNPLAREDILDLLSSLVDKSLVMVDEREDGMRYRMLETIRDYARGKLEHRGESMPVAARHCNHYFVMAKAANRARREPAEQTRRLETELDNLRGAMAFALTGVVDPLISVKFAVAMQWFWILRGCSSEGRTYLRAASALPAVEASDLARAHGLYVAAALAESQSDYDEARRMLEICLVIRRGLGDPETIGATLSTLSYAGLQTGDANQARKDEEEALSIFRQIGDRQGEAIGLQHLAEICAYVGDDVQARRHFEECLLIAGEMKHRELEVECERMLGQLALTDGNASEANARLNRSLAICRDVGDKRNEAVALWWLGNADLMRGDTKSAQQNLGTALRSLHAFDMRSELVGCLEDCAMLARAQGSLEYAVRLCSAAAVSRERFGLVRPPRAGQRWRSDLASIRDSIGSTAFDAGWTEGQRWEFDDGIHFAQSYTDEPRIQ